MFKFFKKIKIFNKKNQKGVALVIAIITMTLLLSVSLSISNIVLRQLKINSTINSSKAAFFAADSAAECAMYYDTLYKEDQSNPGVNVNNQFDSAYFGGNYENPILNDTIKCGKQGKPLGLEQQKPSQDLAITTFDLDYDNVCASVTIEKTPTNTKITARGYNTDAGPSGCNLTDISKNRYIERGLLIKY